MEAAPPPVVAPAPIPSRNVMVWGDGAAMDAMRKNFERKGWRWVTMLLGGQTPALVLVPPSVLSEAEIAQLINDVNAGKFGKLNAGFAQFDLPAT